MFDIGLGEFALLAVLALVVFGPDRLPQVTAQALKWVQQLREQATSARNDLAQTVDFDSSGLKDLAELHPKRIAASVLAPLDEVKKQVTATGDVMKDAVSGAGITATGAAAPAPGTAAATSLAATPATDDGGAGSAAAAPPEPSSMTSTPTSSTPTSSTPTASTPFDPDAT